ASTDVQLADGFHFLPQGDALPVIVPVRMAISFPILLCAVPMRTIKPSSLEQETGRVGALSDQTGLLKNWFSDGGICSNFPIHSFDAWLPRHPTFGINLTSLPKERERSTYSVSNVDEAVAAPPTEDKGDERVRLPKPDDPDFAEWSEFEGIVGFAMAIFHSAQNYRDAMQSRLPSYKERIVQIRLAEGEGGLNLGMGDEVVKNLVKQGGKAGKLLKDRFRPDHHRWVRLRVLMNQLETQLENTETALDSIVADNLLDEQLGGGFPYQLADSERLEDAERVLIELQTLTAMMAKEYADLGPPNGPHLFPRLTDEELQPTLRVTPDV
ncbi:MAG: hypothetical protein ACRDTR_12725, partial [Rubrobacter sp.]